MSHILIRFSIAAAAAATPLVALAAVRNLQGLIGLLTDLLNMVIPLLIALAFVAFLWGLANFILKSDDEKERANGRRLMLWGLIALFVMVSAWAIVGILENTFFGGGGGGGGIQSQGYLDCLYGGETCWGQFQGR